MKDIVRGNRGITVLTLVILIVLMLIIVGISLAMLKGESSVINKADEASEQYDIGKEKEYLKAAFSKFEIEYFYSGKGFTNEEYEAELKNYYENITVEDATEEDINTLKIEIDFQESISGYMKITYNITNRSYIVARIKDKKEMVAPEIPDVPTYTITYNANGGENAPADQVKKEGEQINLSNKKPSRTGYVFKGWSTIQSSTEGTYAAGAEFSLDRDVILYAVWSEEIYTIRYNLDGGIVTNTNPETFTINTETFTLNNPEKEGYVFLGWTGSNGQILQKEVKVENGTIGNKEYTAVFREGIYRVNGEYFIDLKSAIEKCPENTDDYMTIEVLRSSSEETEVIYINNKKILINLGVNTISLSQTLNISSNSTLKIIGNGKIQNASDVAISVEGSLILGENDSVAGSKPIIEGESYGVVAENGKLYLYDGQIIGDIAVKGQIEGIPDSYSALSKTENSKEIVYLDIVADAVARIGNKYYTSLQAAVDEANTGMYEQIPIEYDRLIDLVQKNGDYYFEKNDEGKVVSNNKNKGSTVANSYLELDLRHMEGEHILTVNASISSESNYDVGYATITDTKDAPAYNNTTNRFIYISGSKSGNYEYKLQGGEIYYLHLGYRKDGSTNKENDEFVINSIMLDGSERPDLYIQTPKIGEQVEIIMVSDITVSEPVVTSRIQNIKLNLNGFTLQGSGNTYVLTNNGNFEIVDTSATQTGTIQNSAYRVILNNKDLTITSGNINVNSLVGIYNNFSGKTIINGGNLKSTANNVQIIYNNYGKVYMNNGTITSNNGYGIYNYATGYVEVNNGTIKGVKNLVYNYSSGTINITGGTITGTGEIVINNYSSGTINITGGTITGTLKVIANSSSGTINMAGGTITGTENVVSSSGTMNITGGLITGTSSTYNLLSILGSGNIEIHGIELAGTISTSNGFSGKIIINNCKISSKNVGINNAGTGTIQIKGDTIIEGKVGISNNAANGIIEIGEKIQEAETNEIPQEKPIIKGTSTYGINNKGIIKFYDGTIIGTESIYGTGILAEIERNSEIITEIVDGKQKMTMVPMMRTSSTDRRRKI